MQRDGTYLAFIDWYSCRKSRADTSRHLVYVRYVNLKNKYFVDVLFATVTIT